MKTIGEAEREIEMQRQTLCNLPEFSMTAICDHIASQEMKHPKKRRRVDCITEDDFKAFLYLNNVPISFEDDFDQTVQNFMKFYGSSEFGSDVLTYEELSQMLLPCANN